MNENSVITEKLTLPKIYRISFRKLFVPLLWIPLLAAMIAMQINIMMKVTGVLWFYIVVIVIETFLLARMMTVVRTHLISVTISEDGVAYKQFLPSVQKNFSWENIKRFKYKTVKGRNNVKVYVLEDKSGDKITFNSLLVSSDELVDCIKKKVKLREWN